MPLLTRRRLLTGFASTLAVGPFIGCASQPAGIKSDPFTLGVASGDPDSHSVVLWTRLAPAPLQPDGGMPPITVPVNWEVATDDAMRQVVRRGTAEARPEEGHSIHVVADGLEAGRPYWYRFTTQQAQSRIGRTRTLPAPGTKPARFRLAVAGCQRIEQGYFTGWGDIARSDIDAVFHYGDYIYEYKLNPAQISKRIGRDVPSEVLPLLSNLSQYRMRYALYKLDPDLAAAHAAHPFITSFDDHEISNDWGGDFNGSHVMSREAFLRLRAAAFQAFYENSPMRPEQRPHGSAVKAYRSLDVGSLVRIASLDTRQFRSPPACGKPATQHCDQRYGAGRSMIGAEQEQWLKSLFARGDVPWTLLGNQVMMMQFRHRDQKLDIVDTDKWDGAAAARRRLMQAAQDYKLSGLVTVTGDIHRSFAGNLKVDFDDDKAVPVGAEFVATSMSSVGDGSPEQDSGARFLAANPHMRYYDGRRGYVVCDFNERRCEAIYRGIDVVSKPNAPVTTIASFTVDVKCPGIA